ncbi:hypothetical protein ACFLT2_01350 [Acidobacteriota bacterium]
MKQTPQTEKSTSDEDTLSLLIEASKDKEQKEKHNLISFENPEEAITDIGHLRVRNKLKQMIITGNSSNGDSDRDQFIIKMLLLAGYKDPTIMSIFFNEHLGCSERMKKAGEDVFFDELAEAQRISNPIKMREENTEQQQTVREIKENFSFSDEQLREIQEYIISDLFESSHVADALYNKEKKRFYIFDREERMLLDIEGIDFYCYIRDRYGIAARDWREIKDAIQTKIWKDGKKVEPHNFAFFNKKKFILYVSDHSNRVYKIDGKRIEHVENGTDGVFFEYNTEYSPFQVDLESPSVPNYFKRTLELELSQPSDIQTDAENTGSVWEEFFNNTSSLKEFLIDRSNFEETETGFTVEEQKMLLFTYYYSLFFDSILEEKPIACFVGSKESGKSFLATSIGKIFFGSKFQSRHCPENISDIKTIIGENYYMVFDNVDRYLKSAIIDALCIAATGGTVEKRKLYTDHDIVRIHPHIFMVITSREAKFKRDDLVSRLLLFKTKKIDQPMSRAMLFQGLLDNRDRVMAETLVNLNTIVELLRIQRDGIPQCTSRIADWETFGRKIWGGTAGLAFQQICQKQNVEKEEFGLEDDPLYILLSQEIYEDESPIIEKPTLKLYSGLIETAKAVEMEKEFTKRYKSSVSLGKRIANIREELERKFHVDIQKQANGLRLYTFTKKPGVDEEPGADTQRVEQVEDVRDDVLEDEFYPEAE